MKHALTKAALPPLIALALFAAAHPAAAQNTLRKLPTATKKSGKTKSKAAALPLDTAPAADTIATDIEALVAISGYEKPLRASKETILVTNRDSLRTIDELTLHIEYHTPDGRMLHNRAITVYPLVAPGATRLVTFATWDVNRLFYYHLNRPRTNRQATPYTVTLTPVTAILRHPL